MFNTLKKASLVLLIASTTLVQFSCKNDDPEAEKTGNWYRQGLPSFGGSARTGAVSFVIGDVGYIGTGYTNETVPRVKDLWAYNAKSKIWTQAAPFIGSGRNGATAFVLDGKAYVGTGYDAVFATDNGYKKDFYQYDPTGNKWKAVADFPGTRQYATSFVSNNRAYVGLGFNGSNYYQDFYEYNPATDKWTEIATFIGGKRAGALSFTVGGKTYVGFGKSNSTAYTRDLYSFDPAGNNGTGAWTRVVYSDSNTDEADFPTRGYATAVVVNEKAYIIGGEGKSDVWEYVPGTNQWTEMAPFADGSRGFAASFSIANVAYFGTGSSSGSGGLDDFWAFDPTAPVNDDDNL
ncbi:kelch repeat-containing protein [Dyadobacter sp. CY323]|uniref:Kelch repeat-containing protein n=1 Tax=Dyadobacter sp. CY323 TaxID=2907302 RepID=UPI001F1C7210|nr:kelch repeat-containing protein [Dyadobacter sp. CY323]MCE6992593.1 galactose oxidase [Dyadobacter sp. CY323]